ncbi:MAG: hypothetical protein ACRECQ_14880 [Burkholderiaceae bacterium]
MQGKQAFLVVMALAMAGPALAQVVYRCEHRDKVSLQTHPCETRARQTVKRIEPIPSDPQATQRRARIEAEMDRRNAAAKAYAGESSTRRRTYYNGPLVSTSNDPAEARCAIAKAERDDTLRRVGLRRNFDLLRRLDEAVRAACGRR